MGLLRHRNKNLFRGQPTHVSNGAPEIFSDGKVASASSWPLTSIESPTLPCVEPTSQVCKGDDHARAPFFEYYWAPIRDDWNSYGYFYLIFVVPCIMLYSGEISPTRCNNCVFIRNGFTLHVSGDNLTHHQEYNAVYGHRWAGSLRLLLNLSVVK